MGTSLTFSRPVPLWIDEHTPTPSRFWPCAFVKQELLQGFVMGHHP